MYCTHTTHNTQHYTTLHYTLHYTQTNTDINLPHSHPPEGTAAQCYSEVEKLREAVEAYKEKNMFLANEVLEINHIRSDDADLIAAKSQWVWLASSNMTYCYDYRQNDQLQRDLTRIQGRYLVLLEEMKKPKMGMGGVACIRA